ncbi:MAG TPA: hypothetical protein VFM51_06210 [Solirubrobacterales bacterium]|nr:hypothetical protein [Solirubrobacterales bacterium]
MLKAIDRNADGFRTLAENPPSAPPPGATSLWGSHGGGSAAAGSRSSAADARPAVNSGLDPLSRRLLQLTGLLSVLLIAVVANYLLAEGESVVNPVAAAAEKAEKCPGARFSLYIVYSSPAFPEPIVASGSGAYNGTTERTRMRLSLNSPFTGPMRFVQISDDEFDYQRGDTVDDELPPGKAWVRTESGADEGSLSLDLEETLEILATSGGVHDVGRQSINGRMTHRYRGAIEIGEFAELLREAGEDEIADAYGELEGVAPTGIRIEAWVDRAELLRRLRMVMPSDPGDPTMTIDMRMDFFAYGAKPDVQLPDSDLVVDGPLGSDEASSGSAF